MLSIIICTLNEELYLPKLLETLEKQVYRSFEILIVDGHSTDNTIEVIKKHQQVSNIPIRLIEMNKPGISAQRNEGAKQASFNQLLFLDADVLLLPTFLKNSMFQIQKDNIQIAGTKIYAAERSLIFRMMYWNYSTFYLPLVRLIHPIIHGCSIFVKKEIHNNIGGFKEELTFEDFKYGADAAVFYRPRLLKKVGVKTSARRFYSFSLSEFSELFFSGIYSIFKAGIDRNKFMKKYQANFGNHQRPRY